MYYKLTETSFSLEEKKNPFNTRMPILKMIHTPQHNSDSTGRKCATNKSNSVRTVPHSAKSDGDKKKSHQAGMPILKMVHTQQHTFDNGKDAAMSNTVPTILHSMEERRGEGDKKQN